MPRARKPKFRCLTYEGNRCPTHPTIAAAQEHARAIAKRQGAGASVVCDHCGQSQASHDGHPRSWAHKEDRSCADVA